MDLSVGERLRYWLRQRRMTQAELARRVGVDRSTVSDWVTGTRIPLTSNLQRVVKVLGITMGGFYGTLFIEDTAEPDVSDNGTE